MPISSTAMPTGTRLKNSAKPETRNGSARDGTRVRICRINPWNSSPWCRRPPATSRILPGGPATERNGIGPAASGGSFRGLGVGHVAAAVAAHAHIGLLGMGQEAFEDAKPRAVLADRRARLAGQHPLIG